MTRRIVRDPLVMGGAPVIAGTRTPPGSPYAFYEATVRDGEGHEAGIAEAARNYPMLTRGEIEAAIAYCRRRRWAVPIRRWIVARLDAVADRWRVYG